MHPAQSGRRASAGIQSLDQGLDVMRILAHGGSIKLKDVAARAGMSASKAHRYLASLTRAGWAVQSDTAYRLGPEAIAMAAACLAGVSVMKLAMPILEDLCRRSGRSAGLAVWGSHGPTIVALEETADPVSMNIRPGTVAPVLSSASGLVFAAYAPAGLTDDAIATELQERPLRHGFRSQAALTRALADIRAQGFVSIHSGWVAGIDAVAVPVFDHRGRLEAALLTIGRDRRAPGMKAEVTHLKPAIDILRQSGEQLSHKLGYQSAALFS
ncbi:transcriptional regulator, IclR family [Beijerinckia sp. 28-YEA-48]|nr:transcriptional regulator, IclR family [Beijerinckia sp. 28-YEA-48]